MPHIILFAWTKPHPNMMRSSPPPVHDITKLRESRKRKDKVEFIRPQYFCSFVETAWRFNFAKESCILFPNACNQGWNCFLYGFLNTYGFFVIAKFGEVLIQVQNTFVKRHFDFTFSARPRKVRRDFSSLVPVSLLGILVFLGLMG